MYRILHYRASDLELVDMKGGRENQTSVTLM